MNAIDLLRQTFDVFAFAIFLCIIVYGYILYSKYQSMKKKIETFQEKEEVKNVETTVKGLSDSELNTVLDKYMGKKTD